MSAALEEKGEAGTPDEVTPPVPRRRTMHSYSPDEIGNALSLVDAYGGNILRASNELGIPWSTIKEWYKAPERLPAGCVSIREQRNEERAQVSAELADWIAKSVRQADIDQAGLKDKAIAYGVFTDKAQLLSGQATQISGQVETLQTAQQALDRLLELARATRPDITREEVRARLVARRPELGPLLSESD